MRTLTGPQAAALAAASMATRDFLFVEARTFAGAAASFGFWSGIGQIDADVIDGNGAGTVSRTFLGGGAFVATDAVPMVQGLVVQTVEVTLSAVAPAGIDMVRGYDLRRARLELYRGIFEPGTLAQIGPALCRFTGLVDEVQIETAEEGGEGRIAITATQHSQELRRPSTATRSDADQRLRSATDDFFRHAATCGEWDIKIGTK